MLGTWWLIVACSVVGMLVGLSVQVIVANELRSLHSPSYLVEQLYRKASEEGGNCIIESVRTPGEVDALRSTRSSNCSFALFAVDADPQVRYKRITQRASETDQVTFEEFIENEQREMNNTDPTKQNLVSAVGLGCSNTF